MTHCALNYEARRETPLPSSVLVLRNLYRAAKTPGLNGATSYLSQAGLRLQSPKCLLSSWHDMPRLLWVRMTNPARAPTHHTQKTESARFSTTLPRFLIHCLCPSLGFAGCSLQELWEKHHRGGEIFLKVRWRHGDTALKCNQPVTFGTYLSALVDAVVVREQANDSENGAQRGGGGCDCRCSNSWVSQVICDVYLKVLRVALRLAWLQL